MGTQETRFALLCPEGAGKLHPDPLFVTEVVSSKLLFIARY